MIQILIPDKLIILILNTYGFGATFFATEGFRSEEDWDKKYLTWPDIHALDVDPERCRCPMKFGKHRLCSLVVRN